MKGYLICIFMCSLLNLSAQRICGSYFYFSGEKITLKSNNVFYFYKNSYPSSTWSIGTWRLDKDTLFLETNPVFDTLFLKDSVQNSKRYSLILSSDSISERINPLQAYKTLIAPDGQCRQAPPEKLFYYRNKLFLIDKNNFVTWNFVGDPFTGEYYKDFFLKSTKRNPYPKLSSKNQKDCIVKRNFNRKLYRD